MKLDDSGKQKEQWKLAISSQQAIQIQSYGGPGVLKLTGLPDTKPTADQFACVPKPLYEYSGKNSHKSCTGDKRSCKQ
jgi:hypothetical protein